VFASTAIGVSSNNNSSILNFIGNCTGGSGFGSHGINTNGTINMTGDCLGGTGNNNALSLNSSLAVANITGNVTGGTTGRGIDSGGIVGTSINVTGNITGGGGNAIGQVGISASIVVNGNIIGGSGPGFGLALGGGTLTGNCIIYGSSGSGTAGLNVSGGTAIVKQIVFSSIGTSPVSGRNIFFDNTSQVVTVIKQNNLTANLVDATINFPIAANVRQGVTYASGALTGTLVVPTANTVTDGVVYDNGTIGTAQNTAASFLAELAVSTDPLAERLRNVATVQTTGDQIAAAL
jgi:hypothetical protein